MADRSKGFAYLETFAELFNWTEDGVSSSQRANTPLFQRPSRKGPLPKRSDVILVHDYAGGYNDYEACQGQSIEKELYSCSYLNYVETFVYFSHRLVAIPPPTWTNTCHRNGVEILGTFIVEPGSVDVSAILEEASGRFWVADKLARIAQHYGFDGWLINIETAFPILRWSRSKLERFLRQLRDDLGEDGKVVWYDALTISNFVWYQNTLNSLNLPFALASGSMLTNYAWTPDLAWKGKRMAEHSGLGAENLYFGIDVWAQNIQRDTKHPRITWPRQGGGGTGTGTGMHELLKVRCGCEPEAYLSTGIFGPGWSFEHFANYGKEADEALWLGQRLPDNVTCDCGPENLHRDYARNGVQESAQRFLNGTKSFFHTDLTKAITKAPDGLFYAHLGAQSVLPKDMTSPFTGTARGSFVGSLHADIRGLPSRCVYSLVRTKTSANSIQGALSVIRVAELGISEDGEYEIAVKYRRRESVSCNITLAVKKESGDVNITLPGTTEVSTASSSFDLRKDRIFGIDLVVDIANLAEVARPRESSVSRMPGSSTDTTTALVEIYEIVIQPKSSLGICCDICDVQLQVSKDTDAGPRITWSTEHQKGLENGLPYSEVTGPCSHFLISIDGTHAGRAYASEYLLSGDVAENAEDMRVQITAIGFAGAVIGSSDTVLTDGEAWEVVSR